MFDSNDETTEKADFLHRHRRGLVALLLAVIFVISLITSLQESPTYDETYHLYSGYSHLRFGDLTLNPEHPPLVKEISALPLLFTQVNYNQPPPLTADTPTMNAVNIQGAYSTRFLYRIGNDPDRLLLLGRLPMIALTMLGALLVYLLARELFGTAAALLALALTAVSPVVLGYGRLITFDMACATFIFATLLSYWKYLHSPRATWLLLTAACLALALLTQNTSWMLAPILAVLAVVEGCRALYGSRGQKVRKAWRNLLRVAAILLIALTLVTVFYGLHSSHMPRDDIEAVLRVNVPPGTAGASLVQGINHVSPPLALYASSVLRNYYYNQTVPKLVYLNGEVQDRPIWYYYPEAFFLKTQLGVLALLLLALFFYPWRRLRLQDAFILVPLAFLIPFFLMMRIQFGIKYLIPFYLLLYVFIARGCLEAVRRAKGVRARKAALALVGTLVLLAALSTFSVLPYIIPYFNLSIGSRDNGYRYLVDNNLDWGQDLKRLADFAESEGIQGLQVYYFGGGFPPYYLPDSVAIGGANDVKPGWLALSASYRGYGLWDAPDFIDRLDRIGPYAIVGHSILIYRLEDDWMSR